MSENLENRLDQWGAELGQDVPVLPEASPFLAGVRRRASTRAFRGALAAGAGIALVAAALLLAAVLNPPPALNADLPDRGVVTMDVPEVPTILGLTRAVFASGDVADMPAFPTPSSGANEDWSVGAARSPALTADLLADL
jgi:hypothetical protein